MKKVVKAWATPSSQGTTTYETLLWSDGSLSCDCPGWTFLRAGKPRTCKHTRAVNDGRPVRVQAIKAKGAAVQIRGSRITAIPAPVGRLIALGDEEV